MKCKDCLYFWADCDEQGLPTERECCHYPYYDGDAPCEWEDDYIEYEED